MYLPIVISTVSILGFAAMFAQIGLHELSKLSKKTRKDIDESMSRTEQIYPKFRYVDESKPCLDNYFKRYQNQQTKILNSI